MANKTDLRFTGLADLRKVLQGLPAEMRANILADSLAKAVAPLRTRAAALAPRDTGALAQSITSKVVKNESRGTALALVGPSRQYYRGGKVADGADRRGAARPANYAHLVEFGHVVAPRSGKKARSYKLGGKWRTGSGFVPPRPFLRPALFTTASQVEQTLTEEVGRGIEKTRAKLIASGAHVR